MVEKVSSVAGWLWLGFIAYATLSPIGERPRLFDIETELTIAVERFGAYGLLGLLLGVAYAHRLMLVVCVILVSSIGFELLQLLVPGRDAGVIDVIEKLAGGIAGVGASRVLPVLSQRFGMNDLQR